MKASYQTEPASPHTGAVPYDPTIYLGSAVHYR